MCYINYMYMLPNPDWRKCLMLKYKNYLHLNFGNAVNMLENGSIQKYA